MNILQLKVNHLKINNEEKLIFEKMRELFAKLRKLSARERNAVLVVVASFIKTILKTYEDIDQIPQIDEYLQKLRDKKVKFQGTIDTTLYNLSNAVVLYNFKINGETIPLYLSRYLFLTPSFDIYQAPYQWHTKMEITITSDKLGSKRFMLTGEGILKYNQGNQLAVDIGKPNELLLVKGKK